ncbi:MAG TPA: hypothetical protein VL225_05175 [Vicinamibacterales bacterium]|jgi:hypothetical protein|nr:hypothetical protein [Vicinamibacterales bacterium]
MSAKIALQLNAVLGMASTAAAGGTMWLVLTRPAEVAFAVANREYGAIAVAVASQLAGWLHALLRFL